MMLLDTNILIHYLKGLEPVVAKLHDANPREVAIPSVAAYELEYGARKLGSARRRKLIAEFLAAFVQVPFDHEAAREAARIRIELEEQDLAIGPLDLLIAGTALSRGAVLVTHNRGEFSRVKGLRTADWTR
jgi:tRNA(fMet)-specific endonuclease VapC